MKGPQKVLTGCPYKASLVIKVKTTTPLTKYQRNRRGHMHCQISLLEPSQRRHYAA